MLNRHARLPASQLGFQRFGIRWQLGLELALQRFQLGMQGLLLASIQMMVSTTRLPTSPWPMLAAARKSSSPKPKCPP
jgi:hypothetical protein